MSDMERFDIVIIGGGSAGMAAAVAAYDRGCKSILILEKEKELGGILLQCIHNGFGLHRFGEELAGPSYAQKWSELLKDTNVVVKTNTTVVGMTAEKEVTYVNPDGYAVVKAGAVIMAVGCIERSRGAIAIPGYRPAGVWSAGTAQKYINIKGYMVGKRVFILGSGDIGLIMARRMTLEGAKVLGVAEIMPYSNGLARNIKQCLEDFDIPLYLSHTVVDIKGKDRVEGVVIAKVDENKNPIEGTQIEFDVDTLLLSVGLIPDNSLCRDAGIAIHAKTKGPVVNEHMETSVPGIFACGNGLHVHDLVDYVSLEGEEAGRAAADYVAGKYAGGKGIAITINPGDGIGYVLPTYVSPTLMNDTLEIKMRVNRNDRDVRIELWDDNRCISKVNKLRIAPSEMEKLVVKKEQLADVSGNLRVLVSNNNV